MRLGWLAPYAFFFLLLVVWEAAVRGLKIPAYLLPSPTAILQSVEPDLLRHAGFTAAEAFVGFVLASALAFATALAFVHSRVLEDGLFPIAIAVKTTPLVALAPLLVLWLGTGFWSKVAAAALICFFPVLVNSVKGLKAPDSEYFELFTSFEASRWKKFTKLRLPYCLPYVFAALKISSSLAVVGAIVGEFVGAKEGLGYVIVVSSSHLDTDVLFSAIFASALVGIAMFKLIGWVEQSVVFWQAAETE